MTLYLYRLIPPRPTTFVSDMTPTEATIMHAHVRYWQEQAAKRKVLVFGPVADPEGLFGIAVLAAEVGEDIGRLCKADPAIASAAGFTYKLHLMPQAVVAPQITPLFAAMQI